VADLLVAVGAVVVVVAVVPVVPELTVVPELAVLLELVVLLGDEPLPDFVVVATMAVVVPGISAATAVPIPAVPRTATSTMATVVSRIRRVRDRRLIVLGPSPPLCLCIASSFPCRCLLSMHSTTRVCPLTAFPLCLRCEAWTASAGVRTSASHDVEDRGHWWRNPGPRTDQ
jgi:hypothetical protein